MSAPGNTAAALAPGGLAAELAVQIVAAARAAEAVEKGRREFCVVRLAISKVGQAPAPVMHQWECQPRPGGLSSPRPWGVV